MPQHLEPTYLRYIYDGLVKGDLHPENAAELPDGLIGLYDEVFDERRPVLERQKLLKRFAIWALLKKEVSAQFVAEVLEEREEDVIDFISTYSAWFNSPESGKYQLYHERLKVYLLQKLSEKEVQVLHEMLIARLERAIEEQKADEFERYGLEFLAGHFGVSGIINGDGKKLIELAYSQTHWQRQLKISKGYTWAKEGLHAVMTWASKFKDDEVIECALQLVDLFNQQQNGAPQIVQFVAEGDIETALRRIDNYGGNDKEGQEKKVILYLLCLWQIVNSSEQERKDLKFNADRILEHFNKTLAPEISPVVWRLMFSRGLSTFHLLYNLNSIGVNCQDFLKQFKSYKDVQIFRWNIMEMNDLKDSNEIKNWSRLIDSLPCEISKCSLFAQLAVKSNEFQKELSKELNKVSCKLFKSMISCKLLENDKYCLTRIISDIALYAALSNNVEKTVKFVSKYIKSHKECDKVYEKIAIYLAQANYKEFHNYIEFINDEINYARALFNCSIELIESDKKLASKLFLTGNKILSEYDEEDWCFELWEEKVLATYKFKGLQKALAEIDITYRGNSKLDSILVVINQLIKENKIKTAKELIYCKVLNASIKKRERVFVWELSLQQYEKLALISMQLGLLNQFIDIETGYKNYIHWAIIDFQLLINPSGECYNKVFDNDRNNLTHKLETLISVSIRKLNSKRIKDGSKIIESTSDLVWKLHDPEIRNELRLKLNFICKHFQLYELKKKLDSDKELDNEITFGDYFESLLEIDLKKFIVTDAVHNAEEINAANLIKSHLVTHLKAFFKNESILKNYLFNWYVQKLFFEQTSQTIIEQANRILNLQWAIDIKNQLPN
jgi:hypothetical protein